MAIADYLRKLVELKNQLVVNLKSMGVTADESEKLNTLVPKVLECGTEQNVEFIDDFSTITEVTSRDEVFVKYIKNVNIPRGITRIPSMFFLVVIILKVFHLEMMS